MSQSRCDCASPLDPPPDSRPANALCPNRPPPRVAVCIAGAVRTFPQPQAWRSIKRNLIEVFGGVGLAATSPDVYLDLKLLDDAPKTQKEWRFDSLSHGIDDPAGAVCRAACAFHPVHLTLRNGSHTGPARPAAAERGCFTSGFFGHRENLLRAVSQWSSFSACHTRLSAHEARHASTYDVMYARL
jgi:hypothetical protein